MRFLKTLFNRSINTNRRSLNKRTKTLSLESLEQRIALDASGVRPQLEQVQEVYIDNSLVGPAPMVFGKSELVGHGTKSFVITAVAAGSTVEKWDAATNQWRDVSTPPTSSNPRQLLQLLQNRIIQKDDWDFFKNGHFKMSKMGFPCPLFKKFNEHMLLAPI